MKVQGLVLRLELGAGVWVLETQQGERFALKGGDADLLRPGQEATVEGSLEADLLGVGMSGAPVLRVSSYTLHP